MMIIECIDEAGFEDQLTACVAYQVKEVGENSYLIENDNDDSRWYGSQHFNVKLAQ